MMSSNYGSNSDIAPCRAIKGIYVDHCKGSDHNADGSKCHPFKTIDRALKKSECSGTAFTRIYLAPGTYYLTRNVSYRNLEIIGTVSDSGKVVTLTKDPETGAYSTNLNVDGSLIDPLGDYCDYECSGYAGIVNNTFYAEDPDLSRPHPVKDFKTTLYIRCVYKDSTIVLKHLIAHSESSVYIKSHHNIVTKLNPIGSIMYIPNVGEIFCTIDSFGSLIIPADGISTISSKLTSRYSAFLGNINLNKCEIIVTDTIFNNLAVSRPTNTPYIDRLISLNRVHLDGAYGTISNLFSTGFSPSRSILAAYQNIRLDPPTFDGLSPLAPIQTVINHDGSVNMRVKTYLQGVSIHGLMSRMTFRAGSVVNIDAVDGVYPINLEQSAFSGELNLGIINSDQLTPQIFNTTRGSKVSLSSSSYALVPNGPQAVRFDDVNLAFGIPVANNTLFSVQPNPGLNLGTLSSLTNFPNPS